MLEEALELAQKALKVEESKQRCAFCQLDVLDCHLVEHYTSHYFLEQPGLMVKVLVAKNSRALLHKINFAMLDSNFLLNAVLAEENLCF